MSERLSRRQCLDLLATVSVGRVFVSRHALPVIRPVPFWLIDETILMPVLPNGPIAEAAFQRDVLAFEVDRIDAGPGHSWSVVVTGVAAPAAEGLAPPRASGAWAAKGRTFLLCLPIADVAGRVGAVVWA